MKKTYSKLKRYDIKPIEEYYGTFEEKQKILNYYLERNKEIDFQNERFEKEGIPPYSIK